MTRVFADDERESAFQERGYEVVPLLAAEEIERLEELHASVPAEAEADFYATVFSRDAKRRRAVSEGIGAIVAPRLERFLPDHEHCFSLFVRKSARSQQGSLPLHRDYSFVDADRHTAATVWLPLVDVDRNNGGLEVVEGSHRLFDCPYAVNEYPSPIEPIRGLLDERFRTLVPMTAGDGLVYNARLLHGSGENASDSPRLACVSIFIPREVTPRVYVWDGETPGRFEVLEVDPDYLLEFECGAKIERPYPDGVHRLETVDYSVDDLGPDDLARLPGGPRRGATPRGAPPPEAQSPGAPPPAGPLARIRALLARRFSRS